MGNQLLTSPKDFDFGFEADSFKLLFGDLTRKYLVMQGTGSQQTYVWAIIALIGTPTEKNQVAIIIISTSSDTFIVFSLA